MSEQATSEKEPDQHVALKRAFVAIIVAALVSVLTLTGPDYSLLAADATLKLPFIALEISVATFLLFGPLAMFASWIYFGSCLDSAVETKTDRPWSLFGLRMDATVTKIVLNVCLFLMPPLVAAMFFWKALPRPEAPILLIVFVGSVVYAMYLVLVKVWPDRRRAIVFASVAPWALVFTIWSLQDIVKWALSFRQLELVRTTFKNKDLNSTNLSHAAMSGINFEGASLQRANLSGSSLDSANFSNAVALGVELRDSNLQLANLTKAWLQPAFYRGVERRSVLSEANLRETQFDQTTADTLEAADADFSHAKLTASSLRYSNLRDSSFAQSVITSVTFTRSHLNDASFAGATITNSFFRNADLTQAIFTEASVIGSSFFEATLTGANFSGARIINSTFKSSKGLNAVVFSPSTQLCKSVLTQLDLSGMKASGVNFRRSNLDHATLSDADLSGALLQGAQFYEAKLLKSVLTAAKASDASFRKANLSGADLSKVDATGASFEHANLTDANLAGANLTGANLVGATVEPSQLQDTKVRWTIVDDNLYRKLSPVQRAQVTHVDRQPLKRVTKPSAILESAATSGKAAAAPSCD